MLKLFLLSTFFSINLIPSYGQTVSIKSFGAKGDGRTNDQLAFEKAAQYFNKRKGNGKLVIPKGTYLVGRQIRQGNELYLKGIDVLHLTDVKNLLIEGEKGSKISYISGLKYGSFDPTSGNKIEPTQYFTSYPNLAYIGHALYLQNCQNITFRNIELDGNSTRLIKGGMFGDAGIQAPHYGIFISDSKQVTIQNISAHHFGLDGISVSNHTPSGSNEKDQQILIKNCSFQYNGRQGFSWIGGIGLKAINTNFDYSGKAGISSAPGAGVDIEAEIGFISKGVFENCTFNHNFGCGMVADNGDSRGISFIACEFTGSTNWSAWVKKPDYRFEACKFYGSFVHGFPAENDDDATKFFNCQFYDVKNGKEMYGKFLIESNAAKRLQISGCKFYSTIKKVCWIEGSRFWQPEEDYKISNTIFNAKNKNLQWGDWVGVLRAATLKNVTYQLTPWAKENKNAMNVCCNVDLGGNKILY